MPYEVAKSGSGFVVRKKGGGRVFGRHTSRARAHAQLRALYASEGATAGRKQGANYTRVAGSATPRRSRKGT